MLNTYSLWKYLMILSIVVLGGIYAAPNLYPPDFAIQLSNRDAEIQVSGSDIKEAAAILQKANINYFGEELKDGRAMIRFPTDKDQLRAQKLLSCTMGNDFVVVYNSADTTPDWLKSLGGKPMAYGLDLRGGVHFLLEVDTRKFIEKRMQGMVDDLKERMRGETIRWTDVEIISERVIRASFASEAVRDQAEDLLSGQFQDIQVITGENPLYYIDFTYSEQALRDIEDFAVGQNLQTVRKRVNALGVSEPLVQRMGRNRVVVDLPGIQDPTQARVIINKIATLEFYWEANGSTPASRVIKYDYEGKEVRLDRKMILTGDHVVDAKVGYDPDSGLPQTNITLDSRGGDIMYNTTKSNVLRRMAVLFIETKSRAASNSDDNSDCYSAHGQIEEKPGAKELTVTREERYQEKRLISLATVQSALGVQFRITGLSAREAQDLALLLRAGALAADMYFVEERTVGASLGEENIRLGAISVSVGLAMVLLFMLVYYKVFGLAANIALMANLVLLVSIMGSLSATLTLPGIAGIVLTIGMAVDANVLIFSRIKEELANGMPPQAAINAGFSRAFVTILDANITTLLVAVILLAIGTGPVKGFAVTLSLGIVTSVFTAILGTRAIINLIYGGRNIKKLHI